MSKFLHETRKLIENQEKQISDLEAKLAEKNDELNRYAELFGMKDKDFYAVEKTEYEKMKQGVKEIVDNLKQQLAEKDKQIKKLNLEAQKYYEDAYCNDFHNQDKISFCIGKLEELQEVMGDEVDNYLYSHNMDNYNEFVTHQGMYSCFEILVKCIDSQIKQLKEMK